MRRTMTLAALGFALTASAAADPLVTAPAGWSGGASTDLATQASAQPHFGATGASVTAERFNAPAPGVVLLVVHVTAPTTTPATAAAAELAALHDHGPTVQVIESNERVDDGQKSVEASIVWRDTSTHAGDTMRAILVATSDRITAVTGECLAASDADQALVAACKQALGTLRADVPVVDRIAFAPAAHGTAAGGAGPTPGISAASPAVAAARPALPPISVPQDDPPADKRPLIIGVGLLVLAVVFWWNRRRRARFASAGDESPPEARGRRR